MGKAQHAAELNTGETEGESAARHRGLDVPHDWFIDPADPSAADRMEHGASIEDQATAYLRAAEALEKAVEEEVETKVTSLDEAPSRRSPVPTSAPRELPGDAESQRLTVGMPSLLPTEQVEGELAWQVDALCAQTDPEAFFLRRAAPPETPRRSAAPAPSSRSASTMPLPMTNDSAFGGLSERERRKLKKRRA